MAEHTPGPWRVLPEEVDRSYIRVRGTRCGGRYKIANIVTPFYENVHEREAAETRANARLIAAAPDLLAALEEIAKNDPHHQSSAGTIARAAIARARGEQQ